MKTFGFTVRYFPLPQPTSMPTDPSGRPVRKRSTSGHGCSTHQYGHTSRSGRRRKVEREAKRVTGRRSIQEAQTLYLVEEKWYAIWS